MCEQLDTPCIIDLTLDMRRRTALQRTLEESRAYQDTLTGLISVLRTGNSAEIQDLVTHIQQNPNEEDVVELLQAMLQERRENYSQSLELLIKGEDEEVLSFGTDEEESEQAKRFFPLTPTLPQKRSISGREDDPSRPDINPLKSESAGSQEHLASRYLPLISKLRNVSDFEATRILHDFRTSPVSSDGVAALNLLERRQSRPHLNVQTSQYSGNSSRNSADRTSWHRSLQVTRPDSPTPVAGRLLPLWNDESRSKGTAPVCYLQP
jgi:hypothetical protein